MQVVAGPDMTIIDIVCRWPGSTHDARIFACSRLNRDLMQNAPVGYMLGDAGYTCLPFLLTPLKHSRNRTFSPAERAYQSSHIRTRNLIERFFGAWKSKFQCLHGLRLRLSTSMSVITATAVLWNFLRKQGEHLSPEDVLPANAQQLEEADAAASVTQGTGGSSLAGRTIRSNLINSHFTALINQ